MTIPRSKYHCVSKKISNGITNELVNSLGESGGIKIRQLARNQICGGMGMPETSENLDCQKEIKLKWITAHTSIHGSVEAHVL